MPAVRVAERLGEAAIAAAALSLGNVVLGRALARSSEVSERETGVIRRLQGRRSPSADRLALAVSTAADVPASVLHGVVAVAVLRRLTGSWRPAAMPAAALVLETAVYLAAGALVQRPRPDTLRLDREQPTSSFPSGHQGATVALATVYWLLARSGPPWLRGAVAAGGVAFPMALAWSRVYVGMHYPSDVVVGTVNGVLTGLVAGGLLRPGSAGQRTS